MRKILFVLFSVFCFLFNMTTTTFAITKNSIINIGENNTILLLLIAIGLIGIEILIIDKKREID
ncbi:hypothetical protein R0131_06200 [Clostridium sp. AL.422]|uniref:hypothetical protein n=1 Tax=Clostridium TaxID=1485 RepID=UPI00293DE5D8|nr:MULTISPECIES: hypothetical protein [unclassified Clostridium]MDV4150422.1 hypothetical protein [Clostridium sp. AL.422]